MKNAFVWALVGFLMLAIVFTIMLIASGVL